MSHRIVIFGAGGLVGANLTAAATKQGRSVLALRSAQCDVTDANALESHIDSGDVVINCAAYTRVDDAEDDEAAASAINATGAENLAWACARAGAEFIHISTDYVFSGSVGGGQRRPYEIDDDTGPLSAYGRTKLAGEFAVLAAMPSAHVVRTSWIYEGGDGGDFVAVMRRKAAGNDTVDVVSDQIGSPTYVEDLVGALLEVADGSIEESVLHAANQGEASRFEQAQAVFELVGADPRRVRPIDGSRFPRRAARPDYSALSGRQSVAAGLTPLRPWREALAYALANEGGEARPLPSTRE